jgi:hypothetical protein
LEEIFCDNLCLFNTYPQGIHSIEIVQYTSTSPLVLPLKVLIHIKAYNTAGMKNPVRASKVAMR